jgi:hypothetical protein
MSLSRMPALPHFACGGQEGQVNACASLNIFAAVDTSQFLSAGATGSRCATQRTDAEGALSG